MHASLCVCARVVTRVPPTPGRRRGRVIISRRLSDRLTPVRSAASLPLLDDDRRRLGEVYPLRGPRDRRRVTHVIPEINSHTCVHGRTRAHAQSPTRSPPNHVSGRRPLLVVVESVPNTSYPTDGIRLVCFIRFE